MEYTLNEHVDWISQVTVRRWKHNYSDFSKLSCMTESNPTRDKGYSGRSVSLISHNPSADIGTVLHWNCHTHMINETKILTSEPKSNRSEKSSWGNQYRQVDTLQPILPICSSLLREGRSAVESPCSLQSSWHIFSFSLSVPKKFTNHTNYWSVQSAVEVLLVGLLVVMEESIEFLLENQSS